MCYSVGEGGGEGLRCSPYLHRCKLCGIFPLQVSPAAAPSAHCEILIGNNVLVAAGRRDARPAAGAKKWYWKGAGGCGLGGQHDLEGGGGNCGSGLSGGGGVVVVVEEDGGSVGSIVGAEEEGEERRVMTVFLLFAILLSFGGKGGGRRG